MTDRETRVPDNAAVAPTQRNIAERVGVVAIGRNEGDRLIRCLESLKQFDVPIVYVDSASTDNSVAAAQSRGAIVVALDMSKPFTAARARNEGFAALYSAMPSLDYVQFVDGDCEVEDGWIAAALGFLDSHEDFAVACGRRRERQPDSSLYNTLCDREWNTPIGETDACGGDAMVRISSFQAVDGYDSAMVAGEEPEMCNRIREKGLRIQRMDAPMTLHDADMHHFRQYWLRSLRCGFAYAQGWWTTRKRQKPLWGRELLRAIIWAFLLPLILIVGAVVHPLVSLLFPAIYGAQLVRLAIREGVTQRFAWQSATLSVLGKFAEFQGATRFAVQLLRRRKGGAILYK